jgi:hypothetical protein
MTPFQGVRTSTRGVLVERQVEIQFMYAELGSIHTRMRWMVRKKSVGDNFFGDLIIQWVAQFQNEGHANSGLG